MKCTCSVQPSFHHPYPTTMYGNRLTPRRPSKGALALVLELGSESNAHGFAKIATSRRTKRKLMWAGFVTIGLIAAMVQLSLLVKKYVDFQVVEVSKIRYGMPVLYPSVTVCSLAAVSLTKSKEQMKPEGDTWKWIKFTSAHPYQRLSSVQGFYENLEEQAQELAYDVNDFILHCTFNRKNCSASNFTLHFDGSHYYNCFTFNQGSPSKEDELLMQATGPQYGLSLILALDNDDAPLGYYGVYNIKSNVENSAGVRVTVHEPNTIPFPVDHGFDIPPGYSMSVSLKASLHSRLAAPYGNCTNQMLSGSHTYKHTIFSCLQVCQQDIVVATCGCKASGLPDPKNTKLKNLTNCGTIKGWREMLKNISKNDTVLLHASLLAKLLGTNDSMSYDMIHANFTTSLFLDQNFTNYSNNYSTEGNFSINNNNTNNNNNINNNKSNGTNNKTAAYNPDYLKDLKCEEQALYKLANDRSYEKACKCYQPCSELRYEKSISLSYWPLEFYQYHILETLMKDRINNSFLFDAYQYLSNISQSDDAAQYARDENARDKQLKASKLIRQNLVRLNVYIEDLSVVEFKQMPAYELADLFADIGGTLGLWMGISVLTFMELMELLLRLFLLLVSTERKLEKPMGNGSVDNDRPYSYERTFDTDIETPV